MKSINIICMSAVLFSLYACGSEDYESLYQEAREEHSIQKALKFIELQKKKSRLANGHFLAGYLYKKKLNYDSAVDHFLKANWYYKKKGNKEQQSNTFRILGNIYLENNNYSLALDLYSKAKQLTQDKNNKQILNIDMAKCYNEQSQWPEARMLLREAEQYFSDKNNYWLAKTKLQLGVLWYNVAKMEEQEVHYEKALSYAKEANRLYESPEKKAAATNNIGNAYLAMGNTQEAEHFLTESLKLSKANVEKATTYYNLGRLFRTKGDLEQSIHYHTKSVELCTSLTYEFNSSSRELMDIYLSTNQNEKAIAFNKEFHRLQEKFIDERKELSQKMNALILGNLESSFVIQDERERVWKAEKKQIWIFLGCMAFALILARLWVRSEKQNKIVSTDLANRENQIDEIKEVLLRSRSKA